MKNFFPKYPKLHIKTLFSIIRTYLNGYWSWYGKNEIQLIKKFTKIQTAKYAVTTVSGTIAMETILSALKIGKGDEVIVPAYTWLSTITAVARTGAVPVIVDIDPETLCISPEKIKEAINEKTKAIMPVHLFSAMADMDAIMEIAKEHNLKVIEDCAHAHGAAYKGKGAGSISDAGAFSFQQSKLMCSGEGGIITTNNPILLRDCDSIIHIGWSLFNKTPNPPKNIICTKTVLTEFQCAILSDSCDYIEKETKLRAENANYLENLLKDVSTIRFQKTSEGTTRRSYYYFTFMLNLDKLKQNTSKYNIIETLNKAGIPAENGWGVPVYKHELWNLTDDLYKKFDTNTAENISMNEVICLPHTALMLSKNKLEKVANIIKKVINNYTAE